MEIKIIEKEEFKVVGMPVKISLTEEGYQQKVMQTWKEFIPRAGEVKDRKGECFYGTCNPSKGIEGDACSFEYLAAVEVNDVQELPEKMISETVPAGKYAVLTHKGKLDKLGQTYGEMEKVMKEQNLVEDKKGVFYELYDERFKEDSDESEFDIYAKLV